MVDSMKLEPSSSDYHFFLETEHQKEYEDFESKIQKQNIIIEILKSIDASKIANMDAEGKKNITEALYFIHARPYLSKDMEKNPLGLSYKPPELTYLEKKAIQTKVLEVLPKNYAESLDYLRNMDKEVLDQKQIDDKLIELKDKIRTVSESNIKKCAELTELLGRCVNVKLGDEKKHIIEVINAKAIGEQQRVKFIELLLAQNYNCAADYIDVAFKSIDQFIDKRMAESHAESVNASSKSKK